MRGSRHNRLRATDCPVDMDAVRIALAGRRIEQIRELHHLMAEENAMLIDLRLAVPRRASYEEGAS